MERVFFLARMFLPNYTQFPFSFGGLIFQQDKADDPCTGTKSRISRYVSLCQLDGGGGGGRGE